MAKPPPFDVAIVAGCTAATFFARRGATVALIERHSTLKILKEKVEAIG